MSISWSVDILTHRPLLESSNVEKRISSWIIPLQCPKHRDLLLLENRLVPMDFLDDDFLLFRDQHVRAVEQRWK